MSSISGLSSNHLQPVQQTSSGGNAPAKTARNGGGKSDTGQLSPLAQATSTLEQLQQNDPVRYRQATQQIAQNLNNASQTAQAQGN
jgi:hypothetical protein